MNHRMIFSLLTAALAVGALAVTSTSADAAKKKAKKAKDEVTVSGCARLAAPLCTVIKSGKKTYVVSSAFPPIPLDTGATVTGKLTGMANLCGGEWVQVTGWQANAKACTQKKKK